MAGKKTREKFAKAFGAEFATRLLYGNLSAPAKSLYDETKQFGLNNLSLPTLAGGYNGKDTWGNMKKSFSMEQLEKVEKAIMLNPKNWRTDFISVGNNPGFPLNKRAAERWKTARSVYRDKAS